MFPQVPNYSTGVAKNTRKVRMQGSRIICFVYVRTSLRTVAIRLEYFIRVYAYAYAVHECDISTEIPYEFGYVLTRVIQDAQSRKSLARARVARARHRAGIPDPVNEFSGRFPENSRAAREFSSGWRKSTDANSRAYM